MSYFMNYDKLDVFSFTGNGIPKKMTDEHVLVYLWDQYDINESADVTKLGEVFKRNYINGKTTIEAHEKSYSGQIKRIAVSKGQLKVRAHIILNKKDGKDKNYDKDIHNLINRWHAINPKEFPFYCPQDTDGNIERIENFNYDRDIKSLLKIIGEYTGFKDTYFIDKKEFSYRNNTQEKIAKEIIKLLVLNNKVLFNGHTGLGKSTISPKLFTELLNSGEIVLMTTPIVDTISSILQNIEAFNYGKKIKYFTNDDLEDKNILLEIKEAQKQGYIIFLVFSVQNVRFKDKHGTLGKLRDKFNFLNALDVKLWIRDEYHKEYNGIKTSKVLENINAEMILDLTASIYKLMSLYGNEYVTDGVIYPWDIFDAFREKKNKNPDYKDFPDVLIESIDFNSDLLKNAKIYFTNPDEEYLPKKFFEIITHKFKNENDIVDIFRLKYDGVYNQAGRILNLQKSKNSFTINNDTSLSRKEVGMIIIPEGNNNRNTREIGAILKNLLNDKIQKRVFYTADDFLIQKRKGKTNFQIVEDWVESALKIGKDGICIITHRQLTTGTDITQLGFLDIYDNISSPDEFIQILGRLTRIYDNKNLTKVYLNCPGMSLKASAIMYQLVKDKTPNVTEQKKLYDCMPIVDLIDEKPITIGFNAAINNYNDDVNRFIKNNKISVAYLSKFDDMLQSLNGFDHDKLKSGKIPKGIITEKNLGKNEVSEDNGETPDFEYPEEGEECKVPKAKRSKLETIAVMLSESLNLAVLEKHNNLRSVFNVNKNGLAKSFFKENNLILINKAFDDVEFSKSINNWFDKNLQKFNSIAKEDLILSDELSLNQDFKAKMGLVYIPLKLAQELISKIVENVKNPENILVVNALDGKLPLLLKKQYPKSEIICIEHFNYYIEHLRTLGFKVYKTEIIGKELIFPKELKDMKFDVIVGNPPYQTQNDGQTKTHPLWDKFVEKSFEYLNEDGYLCLVHPSGWRDIEGRFEYIRELLLSKDMLYLEMHNGKDAIDVFGVEIYYDWYVCKNSNTNIKTDILFQDGKQIKRNLKSMKFIPNGKLNILNKIIAGDTDEKVEVLYGVEYHTQYIDYRKQTDSVYKYPVIYTVPNGDKLNLIYFKNRSKYFNRPKLIWSNGRIISVGTIVDKEGKYGLSQFAYAIVDSPDNLDNIKMAFDSKKFRQLMEYCSPGGQGINRKTISLFKKDFWKYFVDENGNEI